MPQQSKFPDTHTHTCIERARSLLSYVVLMGDTSIGDSMAQTLRTQETQNKKSVTSINQKTNRDDKIAIFVQWKHFRAKGKKIKLKEAKIRKRKKKNLKFGNLERKKQSHLASEYETATPSCPRKRLSERERRYERDECPYTNPFTAAAASPSGVSEECRNESFRERERSFVCCERTV